MASPNPLFSQRHGALTPRSPAPAGSKRPALPAFMWPPSYACPPTAQRAVDACAEMLTRAAAASAPVAQLLEYDLEFPKALLPVVRVTHLRPLLRLGEGVFGHVWLAAFSEDSSSVGSANLVAVKQMSKEAMDDARQSFRAVHEARVLSLLRGTTRALVQAVGVAQDAHSAYIIMEACTGGGLQTLLQSVAAAGKRLAPWVARFIVANVLLALEACHARGCTYRDVKSDNIVFRGPTPHVATGEGVCHDGEGWPVLIDFGFARPDYDAVSAHDVALSPTIRDAHDKTRTPMPDDLLTDLRAIAAGSKPCCECAQCFHIPGPASAGSVTGCASPRPPLHYHEFHAPAAALMHAARMIAQPASTPPTFTSVAPRITSPLAPRTGAAHARHATIAAVAASHAAPATSPQPSHRRSATSEAAAGTASVLTSPTSSRRSSVVGTVGYMPPEGILSPSGASPAELHSQDVWALGALACEVLTGVLPFGTPEDNAYLLARRALAFQWVPSVDAALSPTATSPWSSPTASAVPSPGGAAVLSPSAVPPPAVDFLVCALAASPQERPTVAQLMRHAWFSEAMDASPAATFFGEDDLEPETDAAWRAPIDWDVLRAQSMPAPRCLREAAATQHAQYMTRVASAVSHARNVRFGRDTLATGEEEEEEVAVEGSDGN
ncbi:MAG: hypothetical protein EOO41_02050, partial [Methanobacteriota archaeon]